MNGALFARVAADGGDDVIRSIFWAEFDAERETAELVPVQPPAWRVMLTGVAFHTDAVIGKNRYDAMKLIEELLLARAIEIRERSTWVNSQRTT